jgi:hypothetical protein
MREKVAPSYFRRMMAAVVLAGIIYILCEVYIDDVIVHGPSEDGFIDNLKQVFDRFRKFRVTLNPRKCRLGLDRIEFVGHEFDAISMSFSQTKKDHVLNFLRPMTGE